MPTPCARTADLHLPDLHMSVGQPHEYLIVGQSRFPWGFSIPLRKCSFGPNSRTFPIRKANQSHDPLDLSYENGAL